MKRVLVTLSILFFLAGLAWGQEEPPPEPQKPEPQRFIDLDGDGFNDLIPDLDHDGIPDVLDLDVDTELNILRRAWFRSIPDSAKDDTIKFRDWWLKTRPNIPWREAWARWQEQSNILNERFYIRWMLRNGFDPRERRLRIDPNRLRRKPDDQDPRRRRRRGLDPIPQNPVRLRENGG